MSLEAKQKQVCARFNAELLRAAGLQGRQSCTTLGDLRRLKGLRHPPEGDITGWYIWAGEELSEAGDFFQPLYVSHLQSDCPAVAFYLGLA
jgi:hypothetical protein